MTKHQQLSNAELGKWLDWAEVVFGGGDYGLDQKDINALTALRELVASIPPYADELNELRKPERMTNKELGAWMTWIEAHLAATCAPLAPMVGNALSQLREMLKERESVEQLKFRLMDDSIFIRHIQSHLAPGQEVICKICGKTAKEICGKEREEGTRRLKEHYTAQEIIDAARRDLTAPRPKVTMEEIATLCYGPLYDPSDVSPAMIRIAAFLRSKGVEVVEEKP